MAYRTQSMDTSPEIEKIQFDLMRRAGISRRMQVARAHNMTAIRMARHRIALANPQWSEQEVAMEWARLMYGKEIVSRARMHRKLP